MENKNIKNAMLYFGLFCIITGVMSCLFGNVAGGGVVITTGLALILLSQFQIESIKMPGLEAKLINTINEAEIILDKLRKISLPISEIAIATAARAGRYGGATSSKDMMRYVTSLEAQLKGMSVSESEVKEIKKPWIDFASYDLSKVLQDKLKNHYVFLSDKESEFISKLSEDDADYLKKQRASLDKINALNDELERVKGILSFEETNVFINRLDELVNNSQVLTEAQKRDFIKDNMDRIDDINYLVDNGRIRRPEHPDSFPH
ncbi:hypothetical protein GJV08_16510 [Enterobacteriaceae bacterium RIT692]|nr:hypothetical protein [Enterobacteriaceae bacterium RIT692]